jgi:hypothetical protein
LLKVLVQFLSHFVHALKKTETGQRGAIPLDDLKIP